MCYFVYFPRIVSFNNLSCLQNLTTPSLYVCLVFIYFKNCCLTFHRKILCSVYLDISNTGQKRLQRQLATFHPEIFRKTEHDAAIYLSHPDTTYLYLIIGHNCIRCCRAFLTSAFCCASGTIPETKFMSTNLSAVAPPPCTSKRFNPSRFPVM